MPQKTLSSVGLCIRSSCVPSYFLPSPEWVHHPSSSRFSSWLIRKSFVIRIRIVLTPTCLLSWQEKFAKLKSFSCISLRNCKLYLLICPGVSYARSASAAAVPCPSAVPTRKTRSFRQLNNPYLYLMYLHPAPLSPTPRPTCAALKHFVYPQLQAISQTAGTCRTV